MKNREKEIEEVKQSWYKAALPLTVIAIWDFSELYRVECDLPTLFDE